MTAPLTRKLTEREHAVRLALQLTAATGDGVMVPHRDAVILARELLKLLQAQPMDTAPRDGRHFLAYLYNAPDDYDYRGFGEWREIWFEPCRDPIFGGQMVWAAGDPHDSHGQDGSAPDHFGEEVPIAWLPLPDRPKTPKRRT